MRDRCGHIATPGAAELTRPCPGLGGARITAAGSTTYMVSLLLSCLSRFDEPVVRVPSPFIYQRPRPLRSREESTFFLAASAAGNLRIGVSACGRYPMTPSWLGGADDQRPFPGTSAEILQELTHQPAEGSNHKLKWRIHGTLRDVSDIPAHIRGTRNTCKLIRRCGPQSSRNRGSGRIAK